MFLQQKAGHISPESMGALTFVNNAPCNLTIQSDHFNQTVVTYEVRAWTGVCIGQFLFVLYFCLPLLSQSLFPHAPLLSHSLRSCSNLLPHSPTLFPSTHISSSLYSLISQSHYSPLVWPTDMPPSLCTLQNCLFLWREKEEVRQNMEGQCIKKEEEESHVPFTLSPSTLLLTLPPQLSN